MASNRLNIALANVHHLITDEVTKSPNRLEVFYPGFGGAAIGKRDFAVAELGGDFNFNVDAEHLLTFNPKLGIDIQSGKGFSTILHEMGHLHRKAPNELNRELLIGRSLKAELQSDYFAISQGQGQLLIDELINSVQNIHNEGVLPAEFANALKDIDLLANPELLTRLEHAQILVNQNARGGILPHELARLKEIQDQAEKEFSEGTRISSDSELAQIKQAQENRAKEIAPAGNTSYEEVSQKSWEKRGNILSRYTRGEISEAEYDAELQKVYAETNLLNKTREDIFDNDEIYVNTKNKYYSELGRIDQWKEIQRTHDEYGNLRPGILEEHLKANRNVSGMVSGSIHSKKKFASGSKRFGHTLTYLDSETGGLATDPAALLHDVAVVDFDPNDWKQIVGSERLYKVANPYEQSISPIVRAGLEGKVASYEPFDSPRIYQGLKRANETYNEFAGKVLRQIFAPTAAGKTIVVKNFNFETSFFQQILNDKVNAGIREEIFNNLAGWSEYHRAKGKIEITSFDVHTLSGKASRASSRLLTEGMSPERFNEAVELFSGAAEATINAMFNPVPNKTQLLDMDYISRGIVALGQKHGLLAQSGDFFTGVQAETISMLLKQSGVAHYALDDAIQEGMNTDPLIRLYQDLRSGNESRIKDPALQKVFKQWDLARTKAGKEFTTVENYLNIQHQLLMSEKGVTSDLTTGKYTKTRNVGVFWENGIRKEYEAYSSEKIQLRSPSQVTAYYRQRGLSLDVFSEQQAQELEAQILSARKGGRAAKEALSKRILDIKASTRDARLAALESIGKGTGKYKGAAELMAEVIAKHTSTGPAGSIGLNMPWKKIGGVALAAALIMGVMHHNANKGIDKTNNVVFQQDLDRLNAVSEYTQKMSGSPSKLGYRKNDLAADFYAQGMGDTSDGNETMSESRGTELHAQLEAQYKRAGLASETEIEFRDRIHGMHGFVDWMTPDNRVADIKTVNEERFKDIATVGRPFHKGEAQLRYYMEEMNTKSGFLRYVNQDNPDESIDLPVEYDPDKVRADLYKMDKARREAGHAIEIDKRKIEKLKKKEELRRIALESTKQKEAQQHYRY